MPAGGRILPDRGHQGAQPLGRPAQWRERVGIEPTAPGHPPRRRLDLKSRQATRPDPLPYSAAVYIIAPVATGSNGPTPPELSSVCLRGVLVCPSYRSLSRPN